MNRLLALLLSLCLVSPSWGAMDFDGSDDYVSVGPSIPATSQMTVCGWIYLDAVSSSDNELDGSIFSPSVASGNDDLILLWYNVIGIDDNNTFTFNVGSPVITDNRIDAIFEAQSQRWYSVCGTMNGANREIFVDGISRGSRSDATLTSYDGYSSDSRIGSWSAASTMSHEGFLDDVRIYNRALSASEIESLSKSRSRLAITDGLVGWWRLDEGTDEATASGPGTVKDSSGNGNNGTPENNPVWKASSWVNYP